MYVVGSLARDFRSRFHALHRISLHDVTFFLPFREEMRTLEERKSLLLSLLEFNVGHEA
jgi:hypothetical protein